MTSSSLRSLRGIRRAISIVLAGLFILTIAPHGVAQKPDKAPECSPLDGLYHHDEGWLDGISAPGINIVSFDHEQVVFDVAEGTTLVDLCVTTARENDVYNSDATLPATGPITITLTQAGSGFVINAVSFDTDAGGGGDPDVTCPTVEAPDVTFGEPRFIDPNRAGGEPVSVIAQDGSINVSAHAGTTHVYKDPNAAPGAGDFAIGYYNQTLNWRSIDGGNTWSYVGIAGLHEGPHSLTSTGFSDPDFAMDQAGNIYNVEIDLANVAVFKSNDDGQSYLTANPEAWFGDRPWLTALEEDEVFLYVNLPKALLKSVDGGLTWAPLANYTGTSTTPSQAPPISAKALPDPLNPDNGLIGPQGGTLRGNNAVGDRRFWIGVENDVDVDNPDVPSVRWQQHQTGPLGRTQQFFSSLAADNAGNVYLGAAGGYTGGADTTPSGHVSFAYYERETGATNAEVLEIPTPAGDALWPWIIAGDDGRAALVWYQSLAGKPEEFYTFIAVTHNAHGSTVTCSDGHTETIPPRFTVINASQRPVFEGNICQDGTNCNANTSFQRGDRRLGDFFTVNFDKNGDLFIVTADTTRSNLLGGQKPVGNPLFIKQTSGPPMLEEPMDIRPTRCIMNLPVC